MKPVLLGAALLMLAIVSASAAPFSALYAFGSRASEATAHSSDPAKSVTGPAGFVSAAPRYSASGAHGNSVR
jgi:hypothetical protein